MSQWFKTDIVSPQVLLFEATGHIFFHNHNLNSAYSQLLSAGRWNMVWLYAIKPDMKKYGFASVNSFSQQALNV